MELSQVAKLREEYSASAAEAAIADGWQLLAIVPTIRPNGESLPSYVLGKALSGSERLARAGL